MRAARPDDAPAIALILAQAFPSLYSATFGRLSEMETARLLTALFQAGTLSLALARVYDAGNGVAGVALLNLGESIGHGSARDYWRLLRGQMAFRPAVRALCGGVTANYFLQKRIPRANDLAYIEALAVAPDARGRGAGTSLLRDAMAWTRARQRSRLALHVLYANTSARRLYERIGFRPWPDEIAPALFRARRSRHGALRMALRMADP